MILGCLFSIAHGNEKNMSIFKKPNIILTFQQFVN